MTTPPDQSTDLGKDLDRILNEYGYFLGLAYEGENGGLKTHNVGKVKTALQELLLKEVGKAKIEGKKEILNYLLQFTNTDAILDWDFLDGMMTSLEIELKNSQLKKGEK